jgi:dolichol-phosphate mannosyltransferase
MAHISVVIPVYKAEDSLLELYTQLKHHIEPITKDFEIVLVEDCGGDTSWDIIKELSSQDKRVKGLHFSRNFGQHYAITAGLDYSTGDWVIVMDCDLQDRPDEIPRLYEKAMEGFEVVLAKRGKRKDSLLKRLSSKAFYTFFNYMAGIKYDAEVGNFRIISRKVVNSLCSMRENLRFFGGMVDWLGYSTASIDVKHAKSYSGETTYTVRKLFKLAYETIIAYSDKPLRIAINFGFIITLFSFTYGIYFLLKALIYGNAITGWTSLIVSVYFLGGIIIAILGIIGIYLGKTFDETKKRPLYVILDKTFDGTK